jgi:cytidine deaminase
MQQNINFEFEVYNSINELAVSEQNLLKKAIETTNLAYAPYSKFKVGVSGITNKGNLVLGSNQENSSYPVGICGERVLLSALSAQYPNEYIITVAISCIDQDGNNNQPATPCGMCRQALFEHEKIHQHNIRIILGGKIGEIYIIQKAADLLPLGFSL